MTPPPTCFSTNGSIIPFSRAIFLIQRSDFTAMGSPLPVRGSAAAGIAAVLADVAAVLVDQGFAAVRADPGEFLFPADLLRRRPAPVLGGRGRLLREALAGEFELELRSRLGRLGQGGGAGVLLLRVVGVAVEVAADDQGHALGDRGDA